MQLLKQHMKVTRLGYRGPCANSSSLPDRYKPRPSADSALSHFLRRFRLNASVAYDELFKAKSEFEFDDGERTDSFDIKGVVTQIGQVLQQAGLCTSKDFERARLGAAGDGHLRADKVLIPLGLVKERQLAEIYSQVLGLPLVTPDDYPKIPLFPHLLPESFVRETRSLALAFDGPTLIVALADPLDRFVRGVVSIRTECSVRTGVAVPLELDSAINRLFPTSPTRSVPGRDPQSDLLLERDIERLKDMASEAPIIRLVSDIIQRAVEMRASDIHFEPNSAEFIIRYRCDGILFDDVRRPAAEAPAILSRIKIMANLDIAERRLPQDGRFQMSVRGTEIDFRVSTMPSANGEVAVLRILDRTAITFSFKKLGLQRHLVEAFQQALLRPNGLVLVTGPTGSGKTTTLYTGLSALVGTRRNVLSIEDPVEYRLDGIRQIQTHDAIGLTFSEILRSVLRQDPDIIMVGEMRDTETARTAFQAASTGHLVLSTLHTNSASGAITRLRDMGVEGYLVAQILVGVLAQRLVRRLCDYCKREGGDVEQVFNRFDVRQTSSNVATGSVWEAVGCQNCRNTGYSGRLAVGEFLEPSNLVRELIISNADEGTIRAQALKDGMITMLRSGIKLANMGETSIEEVVKQVRHE